MNVDDKCDQRQAIWQAHGARALQWLGPLLILTGVLGFVVPERLALMSGATAYNVFHIVAGFVAVAVTMTESSRAAAAFNITFGLVDLWQVVAGVFSLFPAQLFGLRPADHLVHLALGGRALDPGDARAGTAGGPARSRREPGGGRMNGSAAQASVRLSGVAIPHGNVRRLGGDGSAEALLKAVARDRDRGAFAELFRLYGPRIKGYLGKRGTDAATADEMVQEVMLAVWRKAHLFDGAKGNASTWIFTITRNTLFSHLRHVARPEVEAQDPERVPAEELPDEQLAALRAQAAMTMAMSLLPHEQVDVLRRAYFQGQTLAEVAAGQKVPLGTVKTRVRLALERLRRLIGPGDVP